MEEELFRLSGAMLNRSELLAQSCRKQDYEGVNIYLKAIIAEFENYMSKVIAVGEQYKEQLSFPDAQSMVMTISQILEAQETGDYVLQADYMELSLKPLVLEVLNCLRIVKPEIGTALSNELCAKNLLGDSKLASRIANASTYSLEDTSSGFPTLRRKDERGFYYLHSNVNPIMEADAMVNDYYEPAERKYIVIGCGLGYHIKLLLQKNDYITVKLYEEDANMIKTMLSYQDFSDYIKQGRLTIIYDTKMTLMMEELKKNDDGRIVIHAPSLRNGKSPKVKEHLTQFYHKESGVRRNRYLLESNFYQNYRNCTRYVDELESQIKGKTVIIAAAGPSFTKNVNELKNRPYDSVIIAVSTVAKKLQELTIPPDFVVHSDPQKKTLSHVSGISEDIPLCVLSTAYEGCVRVHTKNNYLIYQNGYDLAEEYAGRHGYKLYETGGSVSMVALDMAVRNNAAKVIVMGLDLAYTDGLAHAKGVSRQATGDLSNAPMVDGYNGGKVPSSLIFADFIKWFSNYARIHDCNKCPLINATEGGADIPGFTKMPLKEALISN